MLIVIKTLAIRKRLPENVRLYAKELHDYFKMELEHLLLEGPKIYEWAGERLETRIQQKIEDTIEGSRTDRFGIPGSITWDLKLLKCGLDPTTDKNTYTSFWIVPDFTALQTGIDDLASKMFINENHFWPSALRRRLIRGVENAEGTSIDGYWYAVNGKVDVVFENMGPLGRKDHKKRAVDALLHH
ncbi:hypothetical protein KI688_005921 [Linnemannia hyalina]|uniref:Uncharacterized protein n=1 Tax=Linnemannia hyalina TaxID=64524 RepID=A0A9P7Y412_9FUNG|nr:hypothetical protein KI688_005921 [Linnemannia hyalina]